MGAHIEKSHTKKQRELPVAALRRSSECLGLADHSFSRRLQRVSYGEVNGTSGDCGTDDIAWTFRGDRGYAAFQEKKTCQSLQGYGLYFEQSMQLT